MGSFAFTGEEISRALRFMADGRVDRRSLVTHEPALADAREAFDMQCRVGECVKVVLEC